MKLASEYVHIHGFACRLPGEIKHCVHLILQESNYCKDTLSFAICGVNRAELIYTTWSFCSVCAAFLVGGKQIQKGGWHDFVCVFSCCKQDWVRTLEVELHLQYSSGNLGYLVHHMSPSIVQNKVIFLSVSVFCLFNQKLSCKHFVQYLTSFSVHFICGLCVLVAPCPALHPLIVSGYVLEAIQRLTFHFSLWKMIDWFHDSLHMWSVMPIKETPLSHYSDLADM